MSIQLNIYKISSAEKNPNSEGKFLNQCISVWLGTGIIKFEYLKCPWKKNQTNNLPTDQSSCMAYYVDILWFLRYMFIALI